MSLFFWVTPSPSAAIFVVAFSHVNISGVHFAHHRPHRRRHRRSRGRPCPEAFPVPLDSSSSATTTGATTLLFGRPAMRSLSSRRVARLRARFMIGDVVAGEATVEVVGRSGIDRVGPLPRATRLVATCIAHRDSLLHSWGAVFHPRTLVRHNRSRR